MADENKLKEAVWQIERLEAIVKDHQSTTLAAGQYIEELQAKLGKVVMERDAAIERADKEEEGDLNVP